MKIVGGRLRGRALASPKDDRTRPTTDRAREAVFNILAHGIEDFALERANVLDLFAGTGALGIEAISRGAAHCVFVETDPAARALIQTNVDHLGLGGVTTIFRRSATDLGRPARGKTFSLVFADPPYGQGLAEQAIAGLLVNAWLAPGAVLVVEEAAGTEFHWPDGLEAIDERRYAGSRFFFARRPAPEAPRP